MPNQFTHILHIADIHIRNYTRHSEYRRVFSKLYDVVKTTPESTLVYIGGDIVHSKTDMSPELVRLTSEFLINLADLRTTIFIKGNHDANLNNESRLDALLPLFENIKHRNLHYLNRPEVYTFKNIDFSVFEISHDQSEWPGPGQNDVKIALFHGPVYNSKTDVGFSISSDAVKVENFKGFDLALLGDIHKRQFVDDTRRIYYPGSLVQQNFGESQLNHGCTIWDLSDFTYQHIELENENAYCTLHVESGELLEHPKLPLRPRVRIFYADTTEAELKQIVMSIKSKCNPLDIIQIKKDKLLPDVSSKKSTHARDTRDVSYQNSLLKSHLERVHKCDAVTIDEILKINEDLNRHLVQPDVSRHTEWRLLEFEFSNMFSYGSNNVVKFTDLTGITGLFAKNHTGKSAFLDSLTFCLFDKCSRTSKAESVMNHAESTFNCKATIEIDDQQYIIERVAKRKPNGRVKCDVTFNTIDETGQLQDLTGEQRSETNQVIRSMIGTYDDFVLTALSVQNDSSGFIDMSQTDKKDLLSQFLDITVFEQLHSHAADEISEVKVLLKQFKNTDYPSILSGIKSNLVSYREELSETQSNINQLQSKSRKIEESIDLVSSTIPAVEQVDINALKSDLAITNSKFNRLVEAKGELKPELSKQQALLDKCNAWLSSVDVNELKAASAKAKAATDELRIVENKLQRVKSKLDQIHLQKQHLAEHEYDPNCKYCCNNSLVKSANELIALEPKALAAKEQLDITHCDIKTKLSLLDDQNLQYTRYLEVISKKSSVEAEIVKLKSKETTIQSEIESTASAKLKLETKIAAYDVKSQSEISDKLHQLDLLKEERRVLSEKIEAERQDLVEIKSDLKTETRRRQEVEDSMSKAFALEQRMKYYEIYMQAVHRDGLPYEIMASSLPELQSEVNEILSQITDFNLVFDTDGKNINTYITYGQSTWDLGLASGMEKFVSSLAIRNGLIRLSSLPRPTFVAIDEGFGNLDVDNLDSVRSLFDHMTTLFDFIIIISHIETMKDIPDHMLEISVTDGYSYIAN